MKTLDTRVYPQITIVRGITSTAEGYDLVITKHIVAGNFTYRWPGEIQKDISAAKMNEFYTASNHAMIYAETRNATEEEIRDAHDRADRRIS